MKEKLTLSVEQEAKLRAKKLSRRTGLSVSRLFEIFINEQDEPDQANPPAGSIVSELLSIIPESEKVADYDYKKLKLKALEAKFE